MYGKNQACGHEVYGNEITLGMEYFACGIWIRGVWYASNMRFTKLRNLVC